MAAMTEAHVSRLCKAKGYYRTPELNEQLFLHFAGFARIEHLDAFVNCKVLWLENNCIAAIENLEPLAPVLGALYMQHNVLESVGGCALPVLETLNVSHNRLRSLDGLACFPALARFVAAGNHITDVTAADGGEKSAAGAADPDTFSPLLSCPKLRALDLSDNDIHDIEALLGVLRRLPQLATLVLQGNPGVRTMRHYRKRLICALPALRYLDETPVDEAERRAAAAWEEGGAAAERQERDLIRKEGRAETARRREYFADFLASARERNQRILSAVSHSAEGSAAPAVPNTAYYDTQLRLQQEEEAAEAKREAASRQEAAPRRAVAEKSAAYCDPMVGLSMGPPVAVDSAAEDEAEGSDDGLGDVYIPESAQHPHRTAPPRPTETVEAMAEPIAEEKSKEPPVPPADVEAEAALALDVLTQQAVPQDMLDTLAALVQDGTSAETGEQCTPPAETDAKPSDESDPSDDVEPSEAESGKAETAEDSEGTPITV